MEAGILKIKIEMVLDEFLDKNAEKQLFLTLGEGHAKAITNGEALGRELVRRFEEPEARYNNKKWIDYILDLKFSNLLREVVYVNGPGIGPKEEELSEC